MEILFKDDYNIYYKKGDYLYISYYDEETESLIIDVPHLNDSKILHHYIDITTNQKHCVYYEYNNLAVTHNGILVTTSSNIVKDHTMINLNLLEDGSIIQR